MLFYDRVMKENITFENIEIPAPLGRYLVQSETCDEFVNNTSILNNLFLVPSCNLNAVLEIKDDKKKIPFLQNSLLNGEESSLLRHTLKEISEELSIVEDLSDMKDIYPILRNFDDRLEVTEFEKYVHKFLFHLEEVCNVPSYHLKHETTKVNVARAKRIPVKAINHLAAHSEDWSRRRIRSVEPRNILSETIEYNLQIYENRVAKRLIDMLLNHFNKRIVNEIEVIEEFIKKIDDIMKSRDSSDSTYWYGKLNRDYKKLGKIYENIEKNKQQLEKIKDFIFKIQNRLYRLLTTELYRENKNTKVSLQQLDRTNLFDNHQHYRYVKLIWNKAFITEPKSDEEIALENQKVVNSFNDFAWVLMSRSLMQIGYKQERLITERNYILRSKNFPDINVELKESENKVIKVLFNDEQLEFIPLPVEGDIDIQNIDNRFYLTLSGLPQESSHIIKIHPGDINSEERLTKLLFEKILDEFTNSYLYHLDYQAISQFDALKNWLIKKDNLVERRGKVPKLELFFKRPLKTAERSDLKVIIKEQRNIAKQGGSKRSQKESQLKIEKLDNIERNIENSVEHFKKFSTCIRCGNNKLNILRSDYQNGFKYSCSKTGCEVEYGFTVKNNDEKTIFYHVKDYKNIMSGLQNDQDILENRIGYEHIELKSVYKVTIPDLNIVIKNIEIDQNNAKKKETPKNALKTSKALAEVVEITDNKTINREVVSQTKNKNGDNVLARSKSKVANQSTKKSNKLSSCIDHTTQDIKSNNPSIGYKKMLSIKNKAELKEFKTSDIIKYIYGMENEIRKFKISKKIYDAHVSIKTNQLKLLLRSDVIKCAFQFCDLYNKIRAKDLSNNENRNQKNSIKNENKKIGLKTSKAADKIVGIKDNKSINRKVSPQKKTKTKHKILIKSKSKIPVQSTKSSSKLSICIDNIIQDIAKDNPSLTYNEMLNSKMVLFKNKAELKSFSAQEIRNHISGVEKEIRKYNISKEEFATHISISSNRVIHLSRTDLLGYVIQYQYYYDKIREMHRRNKKS